MRVTYIGHATLLIEIQGRRLLTDPNFDPKLGRILPRVSAPGIALQDLPELDAILLTHAHADHLSFESLDQLPPVPLYAPPPVARWLQQRGYRHAQPIAPGQNIDISGLVVHTAAATHKGHRYGFDRWRSSSNMYLIDSPASSCFFAGDTALTVDTARLVHDEVVSTGRRLDIALLPIGHAPWWKVGFRRGHLTSADALDLFDQLDARFLIPYHWGTFHHVTATAFDAIDQLRDHLRSHPRASDVQILEPGMTFDLP